MRIFLIVSGIFFLSCVSGQNLKEADNLLQKGEMMEALKLYESVESMGKANVAMYRNMAWIHLQNNQAGYGLLYLEKARMTDPFNSDIKQQIQQVRQQYNLPVDMTENQPLYKILNFLEKIHARFWWWLSLILTGALGVLIIRRYPVRKLSIKDMYIVMSIAAGILLSSAMGFIQYYHQDRQMIVLEKYQIRISPDNESPALSELPEGSKVRQTDKLGDWIKVRDFYGDEGWVPSTLLAAIR
jgi:hypothetical protein